MKAISLWQPWASAVALGSKTIETRSWSTNYRGPLAIHAAARKRVHELRDYDMCLWMNGALWSLIEGLSLLAIETVLPFGAIVATANLVECRRTEDLPKSALYALRAPEGKPFKYPDFQWSEDQLGDFTPGRFGWVLENIHALPTPVPFCGTQGFFNVPDELLKEVA